MNRDLWVENRGKPGFCENCGQPEEAHQPVGDQPVWCPDFPSKPRLPDAPLCQEVLGNGRPCDNVAVVRLPDGFGLRCAKHGLREGAA